MTTFSSTSAIDRNSTHFRWLFVSLSAFVAIFLASLIVRRTGSYNTVVDGWGVDAFELSMGGICLHRYFERSWRSTHSTTSVFPLVMGAACISWALGDVASTIEGLGGATVPVPSVADGFFTDFFPVCFIAFMVLIRRGNRSSLVATSLDGLIAALGAAALSALFIFDAVLKASGGGELSTATNLVYPVGDVLLLALAIGAIAILPNVYRRFFVLASVAMVANLVGDMFNLLQPDSRMGYVSNAAAWPISLLLLAAATWCQPAVTDSLNTEKAVDTENAVKERSAGFLIPSFGALAGMVVLFTAAAAHVGSPPSAWLPGPFWWLAQDSPSRSVRPTH